MIAVILALLIVPLAAAIACVVLPARGAPAVTAVSGVASFGLVLALIPAAAHGDLNYLSYLRVDALSEIFLLATGFGYGAVTVYSIGYTRHHGLDQDSAHRDRYARRFCAGLNLFGWAMLAAPIMGSLALLWIAVEITTVVSALLVAIEDTDGAAEAAWKYVLIASAGLGLALLATVFAYFAGSQLLGEHYNLAISPLIQTAAHLPHTPVRLAFMLAVLGYGTKVGLFPVHTWLPDAHSEAPTPVSALLSGSLLATSFYAILRFYQVAARPTAVRLADAAGLAVATARFALHKERVMRLVSRLCGTRFGRGVVIPGGVSAVPLLPPEQLRAELGRLAKPIAADVAALMATSSFLDRLRGTGPVTPGRARQHGALGPIGKAAGFADDARLARPYDAYRLLAVPPARPHARGDALARLRVRWDEVDSSFRLLRQVADQLPAERPPAIPGLPCEPRSGRAVGWAEAPQGEVLYDVSIEAGRVTRCHPRSASFHNLVLMHEVFTGDILTDFPFIEASFGLSVAGVAL